MSGERLSDERVEAWAASGRFTNMPMSEVQALAREVQELRHLRDYVLPDLRQELDNANAALEAHHKLVADLRSVCRYAHSLSISGVVRMIDEAGL